MSDLPVAIFQHWRHAREEDVGDVQVYRPSSYQFPLARGRTGFEIKPNGEFIQDRIGPTDRTERVSGHWQAEGKDRIRITLDDQQRTTFLVNIVSLTDETLQLRS